MEEEPKVQDEQSDVSADEKTEVLSTSGMVDDEATEDQMEAEAPETEAVAEEKSEINDEEMEETEEGKGTDEAENQTENQTPTAVVVTVTAENEPNEEKAETTGMGDEVETEETPAEAEKAEEEPTTTTIPKKEKHPDRLFIGGLDGLEEKDITAYWESQGVTFRFTGRDKPKPFGFVQCSKEDRQTLLEKTHTIGEKTIRVMEMKKRPKKFFVGGLGDKIETGELVKFFSQWGEVDAGDTFIVKGRGFGFVNFIDLPREVNENDVYGNYTIKDQKIEVKKATPKSNQSGGRQGGRGRYGGPRGGYGNGGWGQRGGYGGRGFGQGGFGQWGPNPGFGWGQPRFQPYY